MRLFMLFSSVKLDRFVGLQISSFIGEAILVAELDLCLLVAVPSTIDAFCCFFSVVFDFLILFY